MAPPRWLVVGGEDKGGILVRESFSLNSKALGERLSTGAVVEELELGNGRLRYRLLAGTGPPEGCVSLKIGDKELLVPKPAEAAGPRMPNAKAPMAEVPKPPEAAGPRMPNAKAPTAEAPAPVAAGPRMPNAKAPAAEAPAAQASIWESVEDSPQADEDAAPKADAPLGGRWRPRVGEPPPPEAPLSWSLVDIEMSQASRPVPPCIFSMRNKMTAKEFREAVNLVRPGAHWGIIFPHTFEMLREAGAGWLTKAFHKAGTLPRNNRVKSMVVHELSTDSTAEESMGGQGMKGWLEVEYEMPHPSLHTGLFVKLPFPYTPKNERMKNSYHFMPDESEILINRLLGPCLPFKIPKYYFGDISYESTNYILISEKLPYKETSWAEGGKEMPIAPYEVEPRIVKFKDYEMPKDGLEQYRAAMRNQGRIVAEYHKGGLGSKAELLRLLPRTPESFVEGIGSEAFEEVKRRGVLATLAEAYFGGSAEAATSAIESAAGGSTAEMFAGLMLDFVLNAPNIFPEVAKDRGRLRQFFTESMEVTHYAWEILLFNSIEPALISVAHGNLAADNAWYWRDADGVLQSGLLDFGGTGHANVASVMSSSWLMAEPRLLKDHWRDLLQAFVDGAREAHGPNEITFERMDTAVRLALAVTAPNCGGNASQLYKLMKKAEWAQIKDRWDPAVNDAFLPRNYTCAMRTALLMWFDLDLYGVFRRWKAENFMWFPKRAPFKCPEIPKCLA